MSKITLALTTALAPARKFTVDGEEFQMLGIDHLSPDDEATANALFARFGVISAELEMTRNVQKGKALAEQLRTTRIQIICKLTDLRPEVAAKIPPSQQADLLEAIQSEVEPPKTDEDTTGDGADA